MLADRELCTGCAACENACNVGAITMIYDEMGWLYPQIDESKCINCGMCSKACNVLSPCTFVHTVNDRAFAAYCRSKSENNNSTSGGFMTLLAKIFIYNTGGTVFGVKWDESLCHAVFCSAKTAEESEQFRTVKYVSSEISKDIYQQIQNELEEGNFVLFTGLPCQVSALKNVVGTDCEKLLTCENICMGATAPEALKQYIAELENDYSTSVIELLMRRKRDEKCFPGYYQVRFRDEDLHNGKILMLPMAGSSFDIFFHQVKRESCFNCLSKMNSSGADFTAGDFIGAVETADYYSELGTSIVFPHTEKALKWMEKMHDDLSITEVSYDKAIGAQSCLFNSYTKNSLYNDYLKVFHDKGIKAAADFYISNIYSGFDSIFEKLKNEVVSEEFVYAIWGCGKYYRVTYEMIRKYFPKAKLKMVVDKFKEGSVDGFEISKPEHLDKTVDRVFITTVMGKDEAISYMEKLYGDQAPNHYTLSMT